MSQDKVFCNKFRQTFIKQFARLMVSNFQLNLCFWGFVSIINCDSFQICKMRVVDWAWKCQPNKISAESRRSDYQLHISLLYKNFIFDQITLVVHNVSRQGSSQVKTDIYKAVFHPIFSFNCFWGSLNIINFDSFHMRWTICWLSLIMSAKFDLFKCWVDTIRLSVVHFLFYMHFVFRQITLVGSQCLKARFSATSLDGQTFTRRLVRLMITKFQLNLLWKPQKDEV